MQEVISLVHYREKHPTTKGGKSPNDPKLPPTGRLWELLDKNINVAVWIKNTRA
jgi:hypothetical protein